MDMAKMKLLETLLTEYLAEITEERDTYARTNQRDFLPVIDMVKEGIRMALDEVTFQLSKIPDEPEVTYEDDAPSGYGKLSFDEVYGKIWVRIFNVLEEEARKLSERGIAEADIRECLSAACTNHQCHSMFFNVEGR